MSFLPPPNPFYLLLHQVKKRFFFSKYFSKKTVAKEAAEKFVSAGEADKNKIKKNRD